MAAVPGTSRKVWLWFISAHGKVKIQHVFAGVGDMNLIPSLIKGHSRR